MPVAGGYFLTRMVEGPGYVSARLLPERLLSLSACICDFVPDVWAVAWSTVAPEQRAAEAAKFGLSPAARQEAVAWTTERLDSGRFGWPCVFYATEDARSFAVRFLGQTPGLRLLGIGLHPHFVDAFLAANALGPSEGMPGVYRVVSTNAKPERGGTTLGWEVLCYQHGGFCSWLCNGLETSVAEHLGITPNRNGFIDSAEDAVAVAHYCGRDDVGSEPGFWAPWQIAEYPL